MIIIIVIILIVILIVIIIPIVIPANVISTLDLPRGKKGCAAINKLSVLSLWQ